MENTTSANDEKWCFMHLYEIDTAILCDSKQGKSVYKICTNCGNRVESFAEDDVRYVQLKFYEDRFL